MKVVFLLDNNEYVEMTAEKLQIRQLSPGISALGTEVVVYLKKEDGTPDLNEDGTPKTQPAWRPLINYNVDLSIPKPVEEPAQVPAAAAKGPSKKKASRKAN